MSTVKTQAVKKAVSKCADLAILHLNRIVFDINASTKFKHEREYLDALNDVLFTLSKKNIEGEISAIFDDLSQQSLDLEQITLTAITNLCVRRANFEYFIPDCASISCRFYQIQGRN